MHSVGATLVAFALSSEGGHVPPSVFCIRGVLAQTEVTAVSPIDWRGKAPLRGQNSQLRVY